VSCAKIAEPVEMHYGMLTLVCPGNMYYMGVDACMGTGTFGDV